jgi:adenylate cyclase
VNCYVQQWVSQLNQDPQTLQHAFALAQKAMALSNSWPWSHIALGFVYLWQKQHEQALAEMEQGVALNPNNADLNAFDSYMGVAEVLSYWGRSEEAVEWAEKAVRLVPLYADRFLHTLGFVYYLAGRYEEAIASFKQFLTRYPNRLEAHLTLAAVYSELGREAEAGAEAAEVLRINPNFSLEVHKQRAPIKDPAAFERHLAALRKAGLK